MEDTGLLAYSYACPIGRIYLTVIVLIRNNKKKNYALEGMK
jgi:hypothetical protein